MGVLFSESFWFKKKKKYCKEMNPPEWVRPLKFEHGGVSRHEGYSEFRGTKDGGGIGGIGLWGVYAGKCHRGLRLRDLRRWWEGELRGVTFSSACRKDRGNPRGSLPVA